MFSLEKLKVYDRAWNSTATLLERAAAWDKRHAVVLLVRGLRDFWRGASTRAD
jgi:hypothetical protein